MEINLEQIKIRDLVKNYSYDEIEGIYGYDGKLNIRPAYQRNFIYKDKQRDEVINTVRKAFPLNVMYWCKSADDTFEVLDGQQRTISICEYVAGSYSINYQYFHNLTEDEQNQILDYDLMVYICDGTTREKLEWFRVINIAGEELTDQELRNAIYTGKWITDAKQYFSKPNCLAYNIGKDYLSGQMIRQDYLETAIRWIARSENINTVDEYMAQHQNDDNANQMVMYFRNVIDWVNLTFPKYRKEMKGVDWAFLYDRFNGNTFDTAKLEREITELMLDDDITNKKGIYPYVLTEDERYLNIRAFTPKQKREAYERQNGICAKCGKQFNLEEMEADHITPWSEGGKTIAENCQMLCKTCNRIKSNV